MKGYSLIELIIVTLFIAILLGLVTINLFQFQHSSQLSTTVSTFISDYKEQQLKAMTGDTSGTGALSNYGIYFGTTSYTEFQNSYGTNNYAVNLPTGIHFSTTFPSTQIIFLKGSGMVSGFSSGQNTITLLDTVNGGQHIITVNQYGVITSVN
jgi:type II secretory pathway pseudopilin PulG